MSTLAPRRRRAFTLVELLIVISIFILLMAIAIPAFSSMLYSSEQSMAENALRIGLGSARDAAIRAGAGRDAAAVFIYERNHIAILPCLRAGTIEEGTVAQHTTREVFAPVSGFEPIRLPRGWMVRGYAPSGMIDAQWYELTYPSGTLRNDANWVFPETNFYNEDLGNDGENRQTFMVRFEGGTGTLKMDPTPVLVLFPSESTSFRSGPGAAAPWNQYRADEDSDGARFVARVNAAPTPAAPSPPAVPLRFVDRQNLLANQATDTILTKGVAQLAVYNERRLAAALGVQIDRATGSLYANQAQAASPQPQFVPGLSGDVAKIRSLTEWLENRLTTGGNAVESDARIFTIHRYLGWLQEVTGTADGQGVSQ